MKISIFGCGYVGLTAAIGFAELGNRVIGIDTDNDKIASLKKGKIPFYEPGLEDLLKKNLTSKNLQFSEDPKKGIEENDIVFCAVATPRFGKRPDISAVIKVAENFAKYGSEGKIFVNKSTVPIGTSEKIIETIKKFQRNAFNFDFISNPEFLREGSALQNFLKPDRIVIGIGNHPSHGKKVMKALYKAIKAPLVFVSHRNAEIIKYAANAFLATKISFVNELANFCDKSGGDVEEVVAGLRHDDRIGPDFLNAGIGFGGSCLPKDLYMLIQTGKKSGHNFRLLEAAHNINENQGMQVIKKLKKIYPRLKGKQIAIWGASFKPNTDDLRDAPSLKIIKKLLKEKAKVYVYDPMALGNLRGIFGDSINYGKDSVSISKDADALLLLTEWDDFKDLDYKKVHKLMRKPVLIDGRNLFSPHAMETFGFDYYGIGRSSPSSP